MHWCTFEIVYSWSSSWRYAFLYKAASSFRNKTAHILDRSWAHVALKRTLFYLSHIERTIRSSQVDLSHRRIVHMIWEIIFICQILVPWQWRLALLHPDWFGFADPNSRHLPQKPFFFLLFLNFLNESIHLHSLDFLIDVAELIFTSINFTCCCQTIIVLLFSICQKDSMSSSISLVQRILGSNMLLNH